MEKYNFKELYERFPLELRQKLSETQQPIKWHPEGNVDKHIELVFEYAKNHFKDLNLMVSALFHDLGKIETTYLKTRKDGQQFWTSPNHEKYAKGYIHMYAELFDDLDVDWDMIEEICYQHMRAHKYNDHVMCNPFKRKTFENLKHFYKIIEFSECDANGKMI